MTTTAGPHDPKAAVAELAPMDFATLAPFNDGHAGAFWAPAPGAGEVSTSPWELHPDTDELLVCLEGAFEVQILASGDGDLEDDLATVALTAGQFAIVPQGHWHRHRATTAFREWYVTPGPTEHSMAADPRSG